MNKDYNPLSKYVMIESSPHVDEGEIDLLELSRTLLRSWKTIFGVTIVCSGLAVIYSLNAPEVFKAETLLAPAQEEKSGTTSALGQFGGLAAMAGVSIPSDSNIEQVLATLNSRKFLGSFIQQKKLVPILFEEMWDAENQTWLIESEEDEPSEQKAIESFKGCLSVDEDKKSGLIYLSISWKDPSVAAQWANELVSQLNEQLRQKAISDSKKRVVYLEQELAKTTLQDLRTVFYNLLESEKQKAMLANVNKDFALEVIDPAVAPETREKPKRKLIVLLGGFCGVLFGILAVCFSHFVQKLKAIKPS